MKDFGICRKLGAQKGKHRIKMSSTQEFAEFNLEGEMKRGSKQKVVLIGDCIRLGYEPVVREALQGIAEVVGSEVKSCSSESILEHFEHWVLQPDPHLLHINCGLQDLRRSCPESPNKVDEGDFELNIRDILKRASDESKASIIWATITPVNQERHRTARLNDVRLEDDVEYYNEAALGVVEEMNLPVDDLFQVVMDQGRDELLSDDGWHFNTEGNRLLGETVAECIKSRL